MGRARRLLDDNLDFYATADESMADVLDLAHRAFAHADATVEALDLDAKGFVPWWGPEGREVTLDQIIVHLAVDEARHAGHMDVLREQARRVRRSAPRGRQPAGAGRAVVGRLRRPPARDRRHTMSEIWHLVHAERRALVDDLCGLAPSQWDTPSLAPGWSVHDVAAHLVDNALTTPVGLLRAMVRAKGTSTGRTPRASPPSGGDASADPRAAARGRRPHERAADLAGLARVAARRGGRPRRGHPWRARDPSGLPGEDP